MVKDNLFTGTTDSSGIIDDIMLPTVRSKEDINSKDDILYTKYHITANYPRSHVKKSMTLQCLTV